VIDPRLYDKFFRLRTLYRIKTKDRKSQLFKPNRIQERLIREIRPNLGKDGQITRPIRHFTLKYRQGGLSTFWLLWWLDDTIFHKNVNTGILAHKKESLGYLWEIIRHAYDTMPAGLRPSSGDDSKSSLSFPTVGSKIFVSLGIRSTGVHNLHISEWCYIDDHNLAASKGATSPNSNITGESTGNGVGNDGYTVYTESQTEENNFKSLFIPWYLQEEYTLPVPSEVKRTEEEGRFSKLALKENSVNISDGQILFRRSKKKELRSFFPQEFPETEDDAFMESGSKFFNNKKIITLLKECNEPIEETHEWTKWEEPDPKCEYGRCRHR